MRKTVFLIGLLLAPLAVPQSAYACSCVYIADDEDRNAFNYENADLVFQGVPTEEDLDDEFFVNYRISAEKVWKGNAEAVMNILTAQESATCGIDLPLDKPVIVFANKHDGKYNTGLCTGTIAAEGAEDLVDWLNDYKEPVTPDEDEEETDDEDDEDEDEEPKIDCTPHICENGDIFPACENGGQIIYKVHPCHFSNNPVENDPPENPDEFSDVSPNHQNATSIYFVKNEGIVQGYNDGTFRPNQKINRAEFTKIIIGANFSMEAIEACTDTDLFSDVSSSDWFAKYICMAKKEGVLDGYPDGTFRPGNLVNFAEAAKIVVIAFALPTDPEDHLGVWWRPYVFALARIGGLPSSFTDPNQELTRGDMAEIIYRVMMGLE